MHPRLADKLGVEDGAWTVVETRRGAITLCAMVVTTIRPDTVFVPYHWPGEKSANRLTVAAASECEDQGIAANTLTPQAAALTKRLASSGSGFSFDDAMFEPLETMAEATLALVTGDPDRPGALTARLAFSLQLLVELQRPVRDLAGQDLVEGWQPADLVAVIARQSELLASRGWPDPFDFGRPHSPNP